MSFIRFLVIFLGSLVCLSSFAANTSTDTHAAPANQTVASTAKTVVPVNINTATVEQLKTLKGIGASKAEAIVDYRTAHGTFKSVDDLANVKGFSSKTVANLQKNNPNRIRTQ